MAFCRNLEILKKRLECGKDTRGGWISTIFTPSMGDPSVANTPLITSRLWGAFHLVMYPGNKLTKSEDPDAKWEFFTIIFGTRH
jgi:hypothetical protein